MAMKFAILPRAVLGTSHSSDSKEISAAEDANAFPLLRLPHPRTGHPALFLPYERQGVTEKVVEILEIHAVNPPASRSWFVQDHIVEDGKLLLMTPIDPLFLLLPIFDIASGDEAKKFRTYDDFLSVASQHFEQKSHQEGATVLSLDILNLGSLACTFTAIARICETQTLDDSITLYRFSRQKLVQQLREKASRLAASNIQSTVQTIHRALAKDGLGADDEADEKLKEAGRLKMACEILSQYLPPAIYQELLQSYDFTSLDAYTRTIRASDTQTTSSDAKQSSNTEGATNSKKRKADTQVSKGAQKLQKTDTSKMPKLTSFFTKKPATSK